MSTESALFRKKMRCKFIGIVFLLISVVCSAGNTRPLYVVDGKIGVTELPPRHQIEQVSVLNPEEAVQTYGKQASGGAVVFTTKEYAREQQARQIASNFEKQKKGRSRRSVAGLLGVLAVIVLCLLQKPIEKLISKIKKHIIKANGVKPSRYDPGLFNSEGVRFAASERIVNYVPIVFLIALAAFDGWVLVKITRPDALYGHSTGANIGGVVFLVGVLAFFIYLTVATYKKLKTFLIIDEKGIRGLCAETIGRKSVYHNIDIRWEQVGMAKMMSPISIEFFKKGLKLPEHFEDYAELAEVEGIEQGTCSVELTGFPANKVKDAVNFFYARYQSQHPDEQSAAKKKSYLLPPQNDEEKLYHWIMLIILILISVSVAVLSAVL